MPADLDLLAHAVIGGRKLPLKVCLCDDMAQHARPKAFDAAEHMAEHDRINAFEFAAQPWLERDPFVSLQHQRVEHHAAELVVTGPRLALLQGRERKHIDE